VSALRRLYRRLTRQPSPLVTRIEQYTTDPVPLGATPIRGRDGNIVGWLPAPTRIEQVRDRRRLGL
jgi:hypothetical protein